MQSIKKQKTLVLILLLTSVFSCKENKPIKVGVLHSLTGPLASSEIPLKNVLLMCQNEINQSGGLLNKNIELVIRDTQSDPKIAQEQARELITKEQVDVIFGCWTSSCRIAVKPVIEELNSLFFYSLQYEGLEFSRNIIYAGAAPNQQIIPGIRWALKEFGHRVFLLGSNYIFPKMANVIIKDIVQSVEGIILDEIYLSMNETNFQSVVEKIKKLKPDIIVNTINGQANRFFFRELKKAGITARQIPVVSLSVTENEILDIGVDNMVGHYAVWNYFDTLDNAANQKFLNSWKKFIGKDWPGTDPIVSSYISFQLWVKAVEDVKTTEPKKVHDAINFKSIDSPAGIVSIDRESSHLWKNVYIGQVKSDGHFDIIWSSGYAVQPVPFPSYRSKSEWQFIKNRKEK